MTPSAVVDADETRRGSAVLRARAVLDLVVEIAALVPEGSRAAFERECYGNHPSLLAAVERAAKAERVLDPAELRRVARFFVRRPPRASPWTSS